MAVGMVGQQWEEIVKSEQGIRALAFALAVGLGAAACGGASPAASTASGGATPSAATPAGTAAQPTEEAATAASETPAAQVGNETSVTSGGITMPARVGAVTYSANEYTGDQLAMFLPLKSDELDGVLDAQGLTRADVVLAIATPSVFAWPTVSAIRISGGDAKALYDQVQAGAYTSATWEPGTIGGKSIARATNADGYSTVLYAKGDVLYLVNSADASLVDPVVATLP